MLVAHAVRTPQQVDQRSRRKRDAKVYENALTVQTILHLRSNFRICISEVQTPMEIPIQFKQENIKDKKGRTHARTSNENPDATIQ
jgi:hypothetical protein